MGKEDKGERVEEAEIMKNKRVGMTDATQNREGQTKECWQDYRKNQCLKENVKLSEKLRERQSKGCFHVCRPSSLCPFDCFKALLKPLVNKPQSFTDSKL